MMAAPIFTTKSLSVVVAVLSSLAGAAPLAVCPPDVSAQLVADTTNGPVTGHVAANTSCVIEYLGIPYAKAPVGELRFAPPAKIAGGEAFEASQYGLDCPSSPVATGPNDFPNLTPQAPRIIGYFAGASGTSQGEDCLTLNVWSRASPSANPSPRPIVVFFHGGRFAIGNTNSPMYTGKYFAQSEDVVVVTVNYRLNIFGFPGAPGLDAQNLGLRDQRAAVEWVRDNAATFRGDPKKIVITGQSSGGVGVDYWTYAFREDPIVHGIVATSGNAFSFPVNAPGVPKRNWDTVVAAVGCSSDNDSDTLACMRAADWAAIKTAAAAVRPTSSSSVLRSVPPFYPIPDGELVFDDYVSRTAAGQFAHVAVLMGNNDNEDGYYRIAAYRNGGVVPTAEQVRAFLLESFTCPVSFQAQARANHSVPAFAYRYLADWSNTRLFPTSGAYHGVDLHMIFGGSEDTSGLAATQDQARLTALMQRAWAAFSRDPSEGLTKALGWPAFDAGAETLALLGRGNAPMVEFVSPTVFDAPCSTVVMGALSTGSGA